MSFLRQEKDGSVSIRIHLQPKASANKIAGIHGEAVKLCLTAPPVEGKANTAACRFLADCFGIPKSGVSLKAGRQSRNKRFLLTDISFASAQHILNQILEKCQD